MRGEMVVTERVPGALTEGYFRDREATAQALQSGAFRTGDLASCDGTAMSPSTGA
jgi:crotonobetaine/carnitine-CoA ligase